MWKNGLGSSAMIIHGGNLSTGLYPDYNELSEIQDRSSFVEAAAFISSARGKTVKYQDNSVDNATIYGVSHDYEKIRALDIVDGRYFSSSESTLGHPVVLLGASVAESLFPMGNAVDKEIIAAGRKLKVIGLLKKEGGGFAINSLDNVVLTPINYVRTIIDIKSMRMNQSIQVKGKPGIPNSELIAELQGVMRGIRKLNPKQEDNFALNEPSLISNKLDSIFSVLSSAGWLIGGFSMLVGGFGIANIMFVSVKERTSIIGIQKSLGAKNYFILMQFLVEAIMLCLIGGAMGLFVIFLGTILCTYAFDLPVTLSLANIQLGLGVSAIIGVISGFMPAYSASQMDPVEAIRAN